MGLVVRLAVALATLIALLAHTAEARAGGSLVPARNTSTLAGTGVVGGPVLAGSHVVWAIPHLPDGYAVVATRRDGTEASVTTVPVPVPASPRLSASPTRVALSLTSIRCEGDCRSQILVAIYNGLLTGPLGGPLTPVAGCQFGTCPPGGCVPGIFAGVSEEALAYTEACRADTIVSSEPDPATAWRIPNTVFSALSGRRLAVTASGGDPSDSVDEARVYDTRSHDQLYRVPDPGVLVDLQEDGKLAFLTANDPGVVSYEAMWVSPADPTPHPTGVTGYISSLRIAGDRIAFQREDASRAIDLGVVALDGSKIAAARDSAAVGELDFDGHDVAWMTQPCQAAAVVIWDLTGHRPSLPDSRCPVPKVTVPIRMRVGSRGTVMAETACPRRATLGCAGTLALVGRSRGLRGLHLGEASFDIPAAATQRLSIRLSRKARWRLRRSGRLEVAVIATAMARRDDGRLGAKSRSASVQLVPTAAVH
jgi:hypothetical protein